MFNVSPIPIPIAVINERTSSLASTLSILTFSTFRILPLSGKIAWNLLLRPSFALPPAESPSTRNNSHSAASLLEQSASLPGRFVNSKAFLRRVDSRAFFAAILARDAWSPFSTIIFAVFGFSNKNLSNSSENSLLVIVLISELPNLVFVCPSNCGFGCLIEIIATSPSRTSSPVKDSLSLISLFFLP